MAAGGPGELQAVSDRRWWQPRLGGPEQDWPAAWMWLLLVLWGRLCEPLTDRAVRTAGHAGQGVGPGAASVSWRGGVRTRARQAHRSAPSAQPSSERRTVSVGAGRRPGRVGTGAPASSRARAVPARGRSSPPDPRAESLAWHAHALRGTPQCTQGHLASPRGGGQQSPHRSRVHLAAPSTGIVVVGTGVPPVL